VWRSALGMKVGPYRRRGCVAFHRSLHAAPVSRHTWRLSQQCLGVNKTRSSGACSSDRTDRYCSRASAAGSPNGTIRSRITLPTTAAPFAAWIRCAGPRPHSSLTRTPQLYSSPEDGVPQLHSRSPARLTAMPRSRRRLAPGWLGVAATRGNDRRMTATATRECSCGDAVILELLYSWRRACERAVRSRLRNVSMQQRTCGGWQR
jgi:hypothetical protein